MAARLRGAVYTWDSLGIAALCRRDEPEQATEIRLYLSPELDPRDFHPKKTFTGLVRGHGLAPATNAVGYRPLYNEACEYLDHAKSSASMFNLPKLSVFAKLDHVHKRVMRLSLSASSSKKKRGKKKAKEPPAPTRAYDVVFDPAGQDGWAFGTPPGITPEQWPTRADVPLTHLFTVRIPEQYRCKEPEVVAMSVFQQLDDTARLTRKKGSSRPQSQHPRAVPLVDFIGIGWCLLYLTDEELRGPAAKDRGAKRSHEKKPFSPSSQSGNST